MKGSRIWNVAVARACVWSMLVWISSVQPSPEDGRAAPAPALPATYSILGYDPASGALGGAVQSAVFSVGNGFLWGEAGLGVVVTQGLVDASYGPRGLALLREGLSPAEAVKKVWDADPDPLAIGWPKAGRQLAVINAKGEGAALTGPAAAPWAGHKAGTHCIAQGNVLAGEAVIDAMVRAFERTEGALAFRLLAALEAGQAAGGDRRGMQSAAMLVVRKDGGPWLHHDVSLRLQVDDHPQPIAELRRLVEKAAATPGRAPLPPR